MSASHAGPSLKPDRNLSDIGSASTAFSNIKQAASDTSSGVLETATLVEINANTAGALAVTPATLLKGMPNGVAPLDSSGLLPSANLPLSAANSIKGNNTGSAAAAIDLTATQATAMLDNATTALKGLVPAPVTASGRVLKDDLSWGSVAGTGTVTSVDITAPAAGITSAGGPITGAGSITLALADDLAALEALATTGYARRTGASAWTLDTNPNLSQAQIYDTPQYATTTGTDTYAATLSPVPTAYATGMLVTLKFGNANTGAATINLNTLGAKTIQSKGSALAAGDLPANSTGILVYDGTNFQLSATLRASSTTLTAWTSYTPTIGGGFGTATSISGYYRQVGTSIECVGEFLAGTVSGSVGTISIPGGFTNVNIGPQVVGMCPEVGVLPELLVYNDGTTVKTNFVATSYHNTGAQQMFRFTLEVI